MDVIKLQPIPFKNIYYYYLYSEGWRTQWPLIPVKEKGKENPQLKSIHVNLAYYFCFCHLSQLYFSKKAKLMRKAHCGFVGG